LIEGPNSPKDIEYISAGTAVIAFFVTLKNWLALKHQQRSYLPPQVMIFDEIDSTIHPSLLGKFAELLSIISNKVQLFITTHSLTLIDCFKKESIYLLRDLGSIGEKYSPISNVLSYKDIIEGLKDDEEIQNYFREKSNSELYVSGLIDEIFPLCPKSQQ
jgi:predicted ATPase